ncbi:hypothetical protein PsorP6_011416 [Peronosclerospora sorghi]|uniref:Uncharacterized protein n=1 Tax=Peronosclerospora sorghi TaxID=230839 RepID=A0ACC0WLM0_9STRA|nr:hypothetical protein PsorP6_011416 [Peronosclerospora sorghi]
MSCVPHHVNLWIANSPCSQSCKQINYTKEGCGGKWKHKPQELYPGLSHPPHIQVRIRQGDVQSRGVNLGGWLVAEDWMTADDAFWHDVEDSVANSGEYTTITKAKSTDTIRTKLGKHHATFITEDDIQQKAAGGLNTVRVPVAFWIVGYDKFDPSNQREWLEGRSYTWTNSFENAHNSLTSRCSGLVLLRVQVVEKHQHAAPSPQLLSMMESELHACASRLEVEIAKTKVYQKNNTWCPDKVLSVKFISRKICPFIYTEATTVLTTSKVLFVRSKPSKVTSQTWVTSARIPSRIKLVDVPHTVDDVASNNCLMYVHNDHNSSIRLGVLRKHPAHCQLPLDQAQDTVLYCCKVVVGVDDPSK